tara:strand:+ start:4478 stop:5239 length:762 start_codon:yes stop_codon:yes gene_type:complete
MSLCGVATSLTGLKDDIAGHLNTVLSLSGFVGTPAGLLSIQGSVAGILATAKGSVLSVLPDVPFGSELLSLRDQIGAIAKLPNTLATMAGEQVQGLLGDFVGIDVIGAINVNDLAGSALRIGASFDPCSAEGGIPNIVKDAAGNFSNLADLQPNIGLTTPASLMKKAKQFYTDDLSSALQDNIQDISSLATTANDISSFDIGNITDAFENNVGGAISGLGQSLKTLPSGATILQSKEDFLNEQISFSQFLEEG